MIKAIIFDWEGVLNEDYSKELRGFCAKYLNVEMSEFENVYSNYKFMFQKAFISENEFWQNICKEMGVNKKIKGSLWKKAFISNNHDRKEVFLILNLLKKKGYKLGLLSNTELPLMNYFFEKSYDKFFDATVFSCAEKVVKPEEEIYKILLKKLVVNPKEVLLVDKTASFVDTGLSMGMKGIVFKDANQLIGEFEKLKIILP